MNTQGNIFKAIVISLIICMMAVPGEGWGQQIIGSYPSMDGGFENQSGTLATASSISSSQVYWTTQTASAGVISASGGRSGPKYVTYTQSGTSHRRLQSPTDNVSAASHVVQFYYQGDLDGTISGDNIRGAASAVGTSSPAYGAYVNSPNTGAVWTKYTAVITTTGTPTFGIGIVSVNNTAQFKLDDFVIYPGSSVDDTPPNSPGIVTVNNATSSSLDVSWIAASGGVDGGGYVVVRYSSDPGTGYDPNQNGIYAVGNSVATGGIVRYVGTGLTFTDDSGLSEGTQYWYKVYTVDKAFNYSSESSGNGTTTVGSTPTITVGSIDGFGNQAVNTTSTEKNYSVSGSDLTANITITPPSGFEISKTSGSGYVANPNTLTLEQSGGTVNSTTIYVVFKPTAVTSYSGNITHVSSGATTQNVAASGTGTSPADPASFTATSAGSSQINLSATANANGNNIVVVWDGDGSFTVPTDGVAAGNVGDAFAGGTIHYKGAAGSLGNHTGLNPNSAYYYKAFSYDALNYYSSGSTANATTSKVEPSNHPSGFTASVATPTYSAITVTWTDATGTTPPDAYLIKGSSVSYAAISNPVDGTAESDGGLVKNITQGTQTHTFTGLSSSTPYYFKIYPYTNSGTLIDYKTDGTIQQSTATTTEGPSYEIGDFGFTAASGNWGSTVTNWKQWDGSGWNTTPTGVPTPSDNVFILEGKTCIVEVSNKPCKNLTIEPGAKIFANDGSNNRYVSVHGDILCDGTFGNGSGVDDGISLNIAGNSCSISGTGSMTGMRIRKLSGTTNTTQLQINRDIELRFIGVAIYNEASVDYPFEVTISNGTTVNCSAGGYTLSTNDKLYIYGKLSLAGTLTNGAGNTGLVIKSTASGTGSLIHNTANIKGTVEKYITAWQSSYGGFHFLSSPVVTENIRPVFVPSSNPIGANQDFYQWDEATNTWINTRKEDDTWNEAFETTFTLGKGYLVAYASNSTKYFRDSLNVAPVPISNLSNTNGKTYAGWHLLGNPFPCAIKWGQGTWNRSAGIGAFAQVWNGDAASYKVLAGEGIIPAMNGFMVYTSTSGGSLTIPADARLHSDSSWYKSSDPEQIVLVAKDMEKGYYQESVIAFQPGASAGFDLQEDCRYLGGYAPMFCSMADQTRLALNTLPMESAHQEIPLYFRKNESGTFRILLAQSIPGSKVVLTDLLLSKTVNLSDVHEYAFASAANDDPNRFVLNYAPVGLEEVRDGQPAVSMYHSTDKVTIKSNDGRPVNGNVMVFNMVGQVVMEKAIRGSMESFTIHAPDGYYIVKLVTDGNILTRKVFVQRAN